MNWERGSYITQLLCRGYKKGKILGSIKQISWSLALAKITCYTIPQSISKDSHLILESLNSVFNTSITFCKFLWHHELSVDKLGTVTLCLWPVLHIQNTCTHVHICITPSSLLVRNTQYIHCFHFLGLYFLLVM